MLISATKIQFLCIVDHNFLFFFAHWSAKLACSICLATHDWFSYKTCFYPICSAMFCGS